MRRIFQAANSVEAHMILHLLEQAGIAGHVEGEYLQGGVGELPAAGLVHVVVPDELADRARTVIREWENKAPPPSPSNEAKARFRYASFFLAGAILGGGVVWSIFNGPITDDGIDYNRDGTIDDRAFYSGSRITRVESDRNFDGKLDTIWDYDATGVVKSARIDDDFDGRFETVISYQRGQPHRSEIDRNGDGKTDYKAQFEHGVLKSEHYLNPQSDALVKQVTRTGGWPTEARIDRDGDGTRESYAYDFYGDLLERSNEGVNEDAR